MKKRGSYDARLAEFHEAPAGSGLRGMRERVKRLGGNLESGRMEKELL
jgi:signal transduction histidine kinase